MARQNIGRIAQRSPTLKDLLVLSMPDCLLIEGWSAAGSDTGSLASLMGSIVHAGRQTAQGTSGKANPEMITIETPEALIFVVPIGKEFAAGFVYERSTTLGLARVQIRDALLELEPLLRGPQAITKPPPAVPLPVPMGPPLDEPERNINPRIAAAASNRAPADRRSVHSIESPPESVPVMVAPTTKPSPRIPANVRTAGEPAATRTAGEPAAARTAGDPVPARTAGDPPAIQPRPATSQIAERPIAPATPRTSSARSRAVRLLEYLQQNAPDPHVSLLRLSLRTGIALERLDRPDLLTDEQVETMAASVRDIVGPDQPDQ